MGWWTTAEVRPPSAVPRCEVCCPSSLSRLAVARMGSSLATHPGRDVTEAAESLRRYCAVTLAALAARRGATRIAGI